MRKSGDMGRYGEIGGDMGRYACSSMRKSVLSVQPRMTV
jgi:hypothetical protein